MLSHLRVAFESAGQGLCPSKGWCGILKPDKIFQTEEEFCDDAGRDSRSGSTQWLGNMQPLWSPGSPPESTKNPRKPRLGVPTCDKKWQFERTADSVKKADMFVGLWVERWSKSYNWVDGTSRTVVFLELATTRSGKNGASRTWGLVICSQTVEQLRFHDCMEVLQRALAILHSEVIKDDTWASRCNICVRKWRFPMETMTVSNLNDQTLDVEFVCIIQVISQNQMLILLMNA